MREMIVKVNGFQREGHEPVLQYAGELIRCRDCKHNRTAKCPMYIEHYEAGYGYSVDVRNEPDDFCSLAEPALSQPETGQI